MYFVKHPDFRYSKPQGTRPRVEFSVASLLPLFTNYKCFPHSECKIHHSVRNRLFCVVYEFRLNRVKLIIAKFWKSSAAHQIPVLQPF
jgi:hypothetical protein